MTFAQFLNKLPPDEVDNVRERAAVIEFYAAPDGEVSRDEAEQMAWDEWVKANCTVTE